MVSAHLTFASQGARRSLPQGHWNTGVFLARYGMTLAKLRRHEDAEETLLESHQILSAALGPDHERTIKVNESLADLYTAWHEAEPGNGYDTKAAEWRAKLPVEEKATEGDGDQPE